MQRRGGGAAVAVLERQPVSLDAVVRLGRDGQRVGVYELGPRVVHAAVLRVPSADHRLRQPSSNLLFIPRVNGIPRRGWIAEVDGGGHDHAG